MMKNLSDYLPEFVKELKKQLESDQKRWGDTWKERPVEGQEDRIWARFQAYYDQFKNAGTPMPWLKIAGLCLIAWARGQTN